MSGVTIDASSTVRDGIRKFVSDTFLVDFGVDADPGTDLFEAGFLDSFGFVELITFLEQTYNVKLGDEDFDSPLIGTLSGIQEITLRHIGKAAK